MPARPTAASTGTALPAVMPVWPTAASTEQATLLSMPVRPVAASARQLAVATPASMALMAPKALGVKRAMDEEMVVVEAGMQKHSRMGRGDPNVVHEGRGVLAPPEQVVVVVVLTDSHTPVQDNGIVATIAAEGRHCEAPPIDEKSNYGESQSEREEEEEEGKTPTQHSQRIQQNKKITKKKTNKAKAAAALAH
ncbi:hypothetical protein C0993_012067 [Termitomyces sp. T159_Od127]|nr:hypothetical protein C0993_012067 [Termitomyces sp. T159_Od127]